MRTNFGSFVGRWVAAFLLVLSTLLAEAQQPAQQPDAVRTDRVRYVLSAPADPAHRYIHNRLERRNVLERISKFLSPFRLPRDVVILVQSCDGDVNAYYENATIVICYEYLAYIDAHAPSGWYEDGVRRRDAIIGPTVDLFLHEMGHAVFDLLKIPVLGREEDAADLFAAYIQLQADREDALALISGITFLGRKETREAMATNLELKHFAKEHGLPGQRYFNVLCVAYGSDPKLFADAVDRWNLPPERAEGCALEYAQIDHAFKTLIAPHLDMALLEEVRAKKWLRFWPSQ
jgi:hypothetical protein